MCPDGQSWISSPGASPSQLALLFSGHSAKVHLRGARSIVQQDP
jgi:hypothetical protein